MNRLIINVDSHYQDLLWMNDRWFCYFNNVIFSLAGAQRNTVQKMGNCYYIKYNILLCSIYEYDIISLFSSTAS